MYYGYGKSVRRHLGKRKKRSNGKNKNKKSRKRKQEGDKQELKRGRKSTKYNDLTRQRKKGSKKQGP